MKRNSDSTKCLVSVKCGCGKVIILQQKETGSKPWLISNWSKHCKSCKYCKGSTRRENKLPTFFPTLSPNPDNTNFESTQSTSAMHYNMFTPFQNVTPQIHSIPTWRPFHGASSCFVSPFINTGTQLQYMESNNPLSNYDASSQNAQTTFSIPTTIQSDSSFSSKDLSTPLSPPSISTSKICNTITPTCTSSVENQNFQ